MTLEKIVEKYGPRIMQVLANLAAVLRAHKIQVDDPAEMFDPPDTYQWGILAYPWAKSEPGGQLPNDALDIWFKITPFRDEEVLYVDFSIDLSSVGGSGVWDFDSGDLAPIDDRAEVQIKMQRFELPEMLRQVAQKAIAYITEARKTPPSGPREWSPRRGAPSMGAAAKERPALIEVKLVDRPEWKARWEPGNEYLSQASDHAFEYYSDMDRDKLRGLLEEIAGEIYDRETESGPLEWSPRNVLGPDDMDLLVKQLQEDHSRLEGLFTAIIDPATWMFEEALMPSDSDIQGALSNAKDKFEDIYRYNIDWELWNPLLETGLTAKGILSELMGPAVHYERNQGAYDRFIIFDRSLAQAPTELLRLTPKKDRRAVNHQLNAEWKGLVEPLMKLFWKEIDKEMSDIDLSNRIDWKKNWKAAEKGRDLAALRREMLEFVREARKKGTVA